MARFVVVPLLVFYLFVAAAALFSNPTSGAAKRHQKIDPFAVYGITKFSILRAGGVSKAGLVGLGWSFSAAAAVEGANFLATGNLVSPEGQQWSIATIWFVFYKFSSFIYDLLMSPDLL
ncbi:hypothetical protein HPP92_023213 [Vanilla planifolia]|uniref:Uncharacterized protein n=1 Tax=Vanilla planifolia TaxID=51239 RepID=A0A835PTD8_VANPL|nr:hypothetical protein HPP92_023213 [Vanilla planifolia]